MDRFGKAAGNGRPDSEFGRWRLLARLGLGAAVTHEAAAPWVVGALALAGVTVLAIPGVEVDAAPAAVGGAIGADGVGDGMRDCLRRYRWQSTLRHEECSALDEMVGSPDTSDADNAGDKVNPAVAAANPAVGAADATDAALRRIECLRRYRWKPLLRVEYCGSVDELVGEPSTSAAGTDGGTDNGNRSGRPDGTNPGWPKK